MSSRNCEIKSTYIFLHDRLDGPEWIARRSYGLEKEWASIYTGNDFYWLRRDGASFIIKPLQYLTDEGHRRYIFGNKSTTPEFFNKMGIDLDDMTDEEILMVMVTL